MKASGSQIGLHCQYRCCFFIASLASVCLHVLSSKFVRAHFSVVIKMFRAELTLCAGVAGSPGSRDLAYQVRTDPRKEFRLSRGRRSRHRLCFNPGISTHNGSSCPSTVLSCFDAMSSLYAKPLLADVTQRRGFEKAELPIDRRNRATILQVSYQIQSSSLVR